MTSTQLTRDDAIAALARTVPPGRDVLSAGETDALRVVTEELSMTQVDTGGEELARFRALRGRGLDPDPVALSETLDDRVILVTGGTGCIGSNLLGELARLRPARLVSVSRGVTPTWSTVPGVEYRSVDIRDREELNRVFSRVRPDVVFHLAAQHNPALAEVEVARTFSTNVLGSANVFDACRRFGATVVHASTGKAMRPYSSDVYAASKKLGEWLLHHAMRDGSLRAAAARFTHVVDNSIIYRRLQGWVNTDTPIRLHDPETVFYLQSAREAAQLLLCASVAATDIELRLTAIRDVGLPISLLDLALGAIGESEGGVVPIYLCGREPGYDHSVYPGLYDPCRSGDLSPLINAFEVDRCTPAPFCDGVDMFLVRADHDLGTLALVQGLGAAALSGADPALLRKQAEECGWAVLTSIVAALPTPVLQRQLQLVGPVPSGELTTRDRQIIAIVGWELRRRGEIEVLDRVPHLVGGRHAVIGAPASRLPGP
jgi:NAD(P)-dependent dehydrogenase (short-subunit alcohol dehydrogenase family)